MRLADCNNCGLQTPGYTRQLIRKNCLVRTTDAVLVVDAPRAEDLKAQELLSSYTGKLLRGTLVALGIDLNSIEIVSAVSCRPPDDREPTPSEIRCCANNLKADIDRFNPRMIVALGNAACQALGIQGTATALQGKWFQYNGRDVLVTYAPTFMVGMPELFADWTFSLNKIKTGKQRIWEIDSDDCPKVPYQICQSKDSFLALLETLATCEYTTLDIETSSKKPKEGFIISCAFKGKGLDSTVVVPSTILEACLEPLKEFLVKTKLGGANLGFENMWFQHHWGVMANLWWDSQLMHHQIDSRSGDSDGGKGGSYHGLKTLGMKYADVADWGAAMRPYKVIGYDKAPKDLLYKYQAADVAVTEFVIEKMLEEAPELFTEDSRYHKIIRPAISMLSRWELEGFLVDVEYLEEAGKEWQAQMVADLETIKELIGDPSFNPQSSKQAQELLFNRMNLPRINKNSTDKKVLDMLAIKFPDHKVLHMIKEYRSDKTIHSTFFKGLVEAADEDNKVHSRLLLHGTPTGRLASRDPNLQNQPARVGSVIRNAFIAPPGWSIFNIDYKQLEFRMLAYYSNDKNLIEFINSGRDIHDEVARAFFHLTADQKPTKNQRLDAKTFVFRIPYGGGPEGVAADFNLPLAEAKRRHQAIKDMFPDAFVWLDEQKRLAESQGFVESCTGLKRHFSLITRANRAEVLRQAGNSPIQGGASDICLMAALRCEHSNELPLDAWKGQLLVHDAYVGIVRDDAINDLMPIAIRLMEQDPFPTPVTFAVDAEYGKRWGEDSLSKFKYPA